MLQSPLSNLKSLSELLDLPYFDFLSCLGFYSIHPGGIQKTQSLVSQMNLKTGESIIEIGSGSGFTSAALIKAGADLTICDPSERLMAAALRNCKIFTGIMPKSINCKAENLPEVSQYRAAILEAVYGFIEDKQAFNSLLPKILYPDGKIGVIDFFYKESPPASLIREMEKIFGLTFSVLTKDNWLENFTNFELVVWKNFDSQFTKPSSASSLAKSVEANFLGTHPVFQDPLSFHKIVSKLNEYLNVFNRNKEYLSCFSAVWSQQNDREKR